MISLANARKLKRPTKKSFIKFSPYFEAIKRNLKEYYEEKDRLLKILVYYNEYDWLEVNSPEIYSSPSNS
jgi:hypothetical protein